MIKLQGSLYGNNNARQCHCLCAESRSLLGHLGISGEVVHTPGHSDDSVSLILDDGSVFTEDLTRPELIGVEDAAVLAASWQLLRERGAARVYSGHGPVRQMDIGFDM
jgi:glyoxylase-like metal-dependent hydrolase (beta-lactamase superfamily II)